MLVGCFLGVGARVAFAQFADTTWTGLAGNGLWGDAGNWSNGVPTRDRTAEMKKTTTIDLGGTTREAKWVYMTASPTISNGTLATGSIRGAYFTIPSSSSLTGFDGQLAISGFYWDTFVRGPVIDDGLDVHRGASFAV